MSDPEARVSQWQRDHDPEPPRDWAGAIPFEGESVPGGVGNEAADVYAGCRDAGLSEADAMAVVGSDAAGNDAEFMDEGTWLGCWRLDWATGELIAAE